MAETGVRAADRAYAILRERISRGEFAAGSRLREESLADDLGLSRTPIREALRRLHSEGLVEFEPHRGAHVTAWTEHDLEDIFGLRALLEGYNARLAARSITDDDLTALQQIADELVVVAQHDAPDVARVSELNAAFHQRVLDAGGSPRVAAMVHSLVHLPLVQTTFRRYSDDALRRSATHHVELVAALRARDPAWAEAVMHAHVHAAYATLRAAALPAALDT